MSNNTVAEVTVQWDKNIDTGVLGKTVVYGTVKGYSRKVSFTTTIATISFDGAVKDYNDKVSLTVNVIPVIIFIDEMKETVRHGEKFLNMPIYLGCLAYNLKCFYVYKVYNKLAYEITYILAKKIAGVIL